MSNRKYEFVGWHPSLSIRRGFRRGKYDPAVSDSFYTSALDPETDVYKIKLKDNTVIPYLTNKKNYKFNFANFISPLFKTLELGTVLHGANAMTRERLKGNIPDLDESFHNYRNITGDKQTR